MKTLGIAIVNSRSQQWAQIFAPSVTRLPDKTISFGFLKYLRRKMIDKLRIAGVRYGRNTRIEVLLSQEAIDHVRAHMKPNEMEEAGIVGLHRNANPSLFSELSNGKPQVLDGGTKEYRNAKYEIALAYGANGRGIAIIFLRPPGKKTS